MEKLQKKNLSKSLMIIDLRLFLIWQVQNLKVKLLLEQEIMSNLLMKRILNIVIQNIIAAMFDCYMFRVRLFQSYINLCLFYLSLDFLKTSKIVSLIGLEIGQIPYSRRSQPSMFVQNQSLFVSEKTRANRPKKITKTFTFNVLIKGKRKEVCGEIVQSF